MKFVPFLSFFLLAGLGAQPLPDPLKALVQPLLTDLPPALAQNILRNPQEFLGDVRPLLSQRDLLRLVDKNNPLPSTYEPLDLRTLNGTSLTVSRRDLSLRDEALRAGLQMARAARTAGLTLVWSSSYRSWAYQKSVFERYAARDGEEKANTYSARPGQSQHQLGTAADFGDITLAFENTPEGRWLRQNAGTYGWSLSFPRGHEERTGYQFEPWHYRYIGVQACLVQKKWFGDLQYLLLEFLADHQELLETLKASE